MIDHIGFSATDYARSRAFYDKALAPLGIEVVMQVTKEESGGYEGVGYGRAGKPFFWVSGAMGEPAGQLHVAFAAPDRKTVDAFYAAAIAAGGEDHGAPGLRPHYHPSYYGAFVLDPDGNNVEAVCHKPE